MEQFDSILREHISQYDQSTHINMGWIYTFS